MQTNLSYATDPVNYTHATWNISELDIPLFLRFKRFVTSQPDSLAVASIDNNWTYADIYQLALKVAAYAEKTSDMPIGILLPAGGELAAAFLGSLAIGRPYVPLDPTFPLERNRLILQHAGISEVISTTLYQSLLKDISEKIHFININNLENNEPSNITTHTESIAYILYTSGSTGKPKGVYQNQKCLLQDIYQYSCAIHINNTDKLTWLYSPSVNGAIRDIYGALLNGATLYALNIREIGLQQLSKIILQYKITIFHAIPPLLRTFLQSKPLHENLTSVRLAYISGDRLFAGDIDQFYRFFSRHTLIYNGIGSTECATLYRHWFINSATQLNSTSVPVGYSIAERITRLIDHEGKPVKIGEIGEVEICSEFIAQGYWNNPHLTQQTFKANISNPKQRLFLTGDLARESNNGLWEYMGRKDGQVKIRGFRVETGAVEAELRQLTYIKDAAVCALSEDTTFELVAYLVGEPTDTTTLKQQISNKLPLAFIPNTYYWLNEIPRLANFKTDLKELKQFHLSQKHTSNLPTTTIVNNIQTDELLTINNLHCCWNEALNRTGVIDDNMSFENYGGDSLKALGLIVLLEKSLNRVISIQNINNEMTINSLFEYLSTDKTPQAYLYIVADRGGVFDKLLDFTKHLPDGVLAQIAPMPLLDIELNKPQTIVDLGKYVADFILTQSPKSSIHILGLSFGARVAFEAACHLQQQNIKVHSLIMGDMGPAYGKNRTLTTICFKQFNMIKKVILQQAPINTLKHLTAIDRILLVILCKHLSMTTLKTLHKLMAKFIKKERLQHHEKLMLVQLGKRQVPDWQPSYFKGNLTVLTAEKGITSTQHLTSDIGWQPYAQHIEVIHLPNGHTTFVTEPMFLSTLNTILNTSIKHNSVQHND